MAPDWHVKPWLERAAWILAENKGLDPSEPKSGLWLGQPEALPDPVLRFGSVLREQTRQFLAADGRKLLVDNEEVAQALVAAAGLIAVVPKSDAESVAPALAAYWHVAEQKTRSVDVVAPNIREAAMFLERWAPTYATLGVSTCLLTDADDLAHLAIRHANDIVVGTQQQFCSDYLRAHMATDPGRWVDAVGATAIVLDADDTLILSSVDQPAIFVEDPPQVYARLSASEWIKLHDRVGGFSSQRLFGPDEFFQIAHEELVDFDDIAGPHGTGANLRPWLTTRDVIAQLARLEDVQRSDVYRQIQRLLQQKDVPAPGQILQEAFERALDSCDLSGSRKTAADVQRLRTLYDVDAKGSPRHIRRPLRDQLTTEFEDAYARRLRTFGPERLRVHEHRVAISMLEWQWAEHLRRVDAAYPTIPSTGEVLPGDQVHAFELAVVKSFDRMNLAVAWNIISYFFGLEPK